MYILTSEQMRESDTLAIHQYGIPSIVLMENATSGVADVILNHYASASRIIILAGRGNNGGDGLAAARHLFNRGLEIHVWLFSSQKSLKGDAAKNLQIVKRMGIPFKTIRSSRQLSESVDELVASDLVVDALFGTGLTKPMTGLFEDTAGLLNTLRVPVVSVDIPSGLSGSSADLIGPAVRADVTVTFAALKPAHIFPPAADFSGEVVVVDIGIPMEVLEGMSRLELITHDDMLPFVVERERDSHKGTYGHAVIIAGSRNKPGAAALAAQAAYRVGAGLVTVAAVDPVIQMTIQAWPQVMGFSLKENEGGMIHSSELSRLIEFCSDKSAVLIGPGLGTEESMQDFIRTFVGAVNQPVVTDADALTALGSRLDLINDRAAPTVLTPHPKEMAALTGKTVLDVQESRLALAEHAARTSNAVCVLKGFQTLTSHPEGRTYVNSSGNPGMATGGSGDVLGGMITGFLAQGFPEDVAAWGGVYLHGRAGDMAAEQLGEISLVAGDLLDFIPEALHWIKKPS